MDQIIVQGGNWLNGRVKIEGAKNAVLPILAASILAETGKVELSNVPVLSDVHTINELLMAINVDSEFDEKNNHVTIDAQGDISTTADYDFVSKMRASILVMGSLLSRFGHAKVAIPGGCAIGTRPIDLHLKGFEALGATITRADGYVEAHADQLVGADIYLDFPSVGATQNLMMAAALAQGTTTIKNVACEPEIQDLEVFLNAMGAKVSGAGSETITIEGVPSLHGTAHSVVSDRIEAGTFMVASAITQGDVLVENIVPEHNLPLISKLREMGVTIEEYENSVRVIGPKTLKAVDIQTLPHPGFPTDMQAQMSVAQLLAEGTSALTETVFENRFMHFEELRRMRADFKIDRQNVVMLGPTEFTGASVQATDLRAGAALILAGLRAEGITQVGNLTHLDRGYYKFHEKLQKLGANVQRISSESSASIKIKETI